MGGGFTMSKKRNTMNAHNCPVNVAGVTNSSTSQNAMISSQTTGDGSEMPIFFAVKPQNQQPATKPTAISTAHSATVRCGLNTTNDAHANKVPTVPGAIGDKPLPKPSDRMCSGCDSMKRALVRRDGFGGGVSSIVSMIGSVCMKMVEARVWIRNRTRDRKSTRLNSSHLGISYAVFCLKKKKKLKIKSKKQKQRANDSRT